MAATAFQLTQLAEIVRDRYDNDSALKNATATTDSLFFSQVPQNAAMPYVVFDLIDSTPQYQLNLADTPIDTARISFRVFARTAAEIDEALAAIDDAYGPDNVPITGSDNYTVVAAIPVFMHAEFDAEEAVWQGTIDFTWTLHRK